MGTDKDNEVTPRAAGGAHVKDERPPRNVGDDAPPEGARSEKEEKPGDESQTTAGGHGSPGRGGAKGRRNHLRQLRLDRMMSKAELARRAGVSTLTIDRIERGLSCRMDTKRKILEALGLTPQDRVMVFGEDD
jgi:DNA-binding XRE family transcriptional regulator